MAESSAKRCAVVTGANKGIGYAICKELVSRGIFVILTSRDETRGREAVNNLDTLSDSVVFHQLDVTHPNSVATLTEFVNNRFGKLDILVNNAGVGGAILDVDAMRVCGIGKGKMDWSKVSTETYELAKECLQVNYYGVKRMVESCLHLLRLSDSPRIVNVSSTIAKLEYLPEGWAKQVLSNIETLTEAKVDEVVEEFLKDFKEGLLESKGWPVGLSAYHMSKVALNAYTRILALKLPTGFCVNCVCPGFVKTDLNCHTDGILHPRRRCKRSHTTSHVTRGRAHGPVLCDDKGRVFRLKTVRSKARSLLLNVLTLK